MHVLPTLWNPSTSRFTTELKVTLSQDRRTGEKVTNFTSSCHGSFTILASLSTRTQTMNKAQNYFLAQLELSQLYLACPVLNFPLALHHYSSLDFCQGIQLMGTNNIQPCASHGARQCATPVQSHGKCRVRKDEVSELLQLYQLDRDLHSAGSLVSAREKEEKLCH